MFVDLIIDELANDATTTTIVTSVVKDVDEGKIVKVAFIIGKVRDLTASEHDWIKVVFSLAPNVEYIKRGKIDDGKKGKYLKLTSREKDLALQLFENHLE